MAPKIGFVDIETAPMTAYIWGLFDRFTPTDRVIDSGRTLCFAHSWGEGTTRFSAEWDKGGSIMMLAEAWNFLDRADWVVHYNGKKFDIPTLNKEFVQLGWHPPSPYKQLDLFQTVKRVFRFPSNKLDYVAQTLGLGEKAKHPGFQMWVDVMKGCPEAREMMKGYNIQDVDLLHSLYHRLRPWCPQHPAFNLYDSAHTFACPACGSTHLERRGHAFTQAGKFQRYHCLDCGKWARDRSNMVNKERRSNVLSNIV